MERHRGGRSGNCVEQEDDQRGSSNGETSGRRRNGRHRRREPKSKAALTPHGHPSELPPRFLTNRQNKAPPKTGSKVNQALNKKPPSSSKDTNRWVQSPPHPHSSIPPSPSSTQPHQKQQPHLFHTTNNSSISSSSSIQSTGIHATTNPTATIQSCDIGTTSGYTSNHHQHRHQKQATGVATNPPSSSTGFGMNTGTVVSVSDGGWSHGMPERGSGWRNVAAASTNAGSSSGWDASGSSGGTEKSGSGWVSTERGATNRPSSISADGWGSKSARPPQGNQKGVWDKGSEITSQEGKAKQGALSEERRGHEGGGVNGISMWGANKTPRDVVGTNWKVSEDSAGNDDQHSSDYSTDTYSPPNEDRPSVEPNRQRKQDGDLDHVSLSSDTHGYSHSQESYRGVNSSPAAFGPSETISLGSSGGNSHSGDYQSSGNFSSSHDSHVIGGSDEADNHGFESPYSRVSPRNGAGTPIQAGGRSGGVTPTQGGKDRGENAWSMRVRSTSSVSSVGSGSSWKGSADSKNGGGAGFPGRSNSPRKNSRSHLPRLHPSGHHEDATPSLPNSYSNGMGAGKNFPRKSKKLAEYEEGLGSLQNAPSGWGELPSPKLSDLDNGTEFWGIPPADLERQSREKAKSSRSSTSAMQSAGDMGWLDGSPPEVDWVEDLGTPWGAGSGGGGPSSGSMDSWASLNKDKMVFADNVVQLMNMGMNRSSAEKLLGSTNNNLEMAMLMASGGEDTAFEMAASTVPPSFSPRKPPHGGGKGSQGVVTPTFGTVSSGLGQDLMGPMNALQGMQNQMPPPTTPQQQVKSQSQLKLLQMQQQYLLPGGVPPNQPLSLQNYLQVMNQRYTKLQKNKQVLTQQLKMSGGDSSTAHQISLKLQRVQHQIAQIEVDQQRLVMAHLPNQQDGSGGASSLKPQDPLVSPMMGVAPRGGKGFSGKQGPVGRSHSTSGILEEDGKGLPYNMQGLSLGVSVSQSSARSVSRFHQIFSGSSSDNLMGLGGGMEGQDMVLSGGSQGSSPFSPPQGAAFPARGGMGESVPSASTPSGSAPLLPSGSGKQFSDIQEFRPGVPWQPRSQATEPAQLYSKQVSMPASGLMYGGLGENYSAPMAPSPVFTNLPSPMLGGNGAQSGHPSKSFTGGSSIGGAPTHKYMRSNSVGSGYYGGGGSGSGFMGNKRLPSPSPAKYTHYPRSDNARQSFGQGGMAGGWGNSTGSSMSSESAYSRTIYPSRGAGHTAVSPVSMATSSQFPPGSAGMGDGPASWKPPKQQPPAGRRMAPPTSLAPRPRGNGLNNSRGMGTPLGTRELFDSNSSSDNNWGALGMTPGAPMTPGLSNPVWGSTPLGTPDDPSIPLQQNQWGKDDVSKIWNQTSQPDTFSSAPSKPPGLSVTSDPSAPPYMKTPSEQSGERAKPFATTPSLSSGSSTWAQDEMRSSEAQKAAMSPEPTFAEWRSGKPARLATTNSPWLVIRNINTQIDTASLRDVCCKYGIVRVCHTHYQSELALICFSSMDEAIQAKTGLDKNPTISGVPISAQFASEANIRDLCEQLQVGINSEQHRGWPDDARGGSAEATSVVTHKTSLSLSDVNSATTHPQWESHTPSSAPFSRQGSELSMTSTPGSSSMWSDGGFLSGFSSPWLSSGTVSSTSMGSSSGGGVGGVNMTSSDGPRSMTLPQDTTTVGNFALRTNGQSFLPGGML